jgi:serine/threonine protein kinase
MSGRDFLPELVRDTELPVSFPTEKLTIHTRRWHHSRREIWHRRRILGHGGYGLVWLEQEITKDGKPLEGSIRAVKQIRCSKPSDTLASYQRELEAIAKFSQPKYADYFVKSHGWYQGPDALFIAMEYCPCGDLRHYMDSHGQLPEPEVKTITTQVLRALAYMHEEKFAHRDIKPAVCLETGP